MPRLPTKAETKGADEIRPGKLSLPAKEAEDRPAAAARIISPNPANHVIDCGNILCYPAGSGCIKRRSSSKS